MTAGKWGNLPVHIWPHLKGRWGDPPRQVPGLPDGVTLSARVNFCHVNVSRWGNPPSRDRIRVASNSRQMPLAEALHQQRWKPHHWNVTARSESESREALTAKTHRLPIIFVFKCLATIQYSWKNAPRDSGVLGCMKHGSFSPLQRVTSPAWGSPPPM